MAGDNPFFALQQRLADLIGSSDYFTGLQQSQILTEQVGDLQNQVDTGLLPLGFGVVITTAAGKSTENEYRTLLTNEDLNIYIITNPTLDPGHNALDALWAVIQAVQGASIAALPPVAATPSKFFHVTGHQRRHDAPAGVHGHELYVTAVARLL